MNRVVRVLVVDDSALVRDILARGLSLDPKIEVVGKASDPYKARDLIVQVKPDVLTLDVEMPRMDGLEFLKKLMPQFPLPVVMVSALTRRGTQITLEALEAGAVDFVSKPSTDLSRGLVTIIQELRQKVITASTIDVRKFKQEIKPGKPIERLSKKALAESTDKVIAIGASTGGTEAIREVISSFPPNMPGVVIVQHMPAGFTKMFAERMNDLCEMDVKEAESGDRVMVGRVLIAPGDYHMKLRRSGGIYRVHCSNGELVCGHRPSVGILFKSVAETAGTNAIGIILTGMGHDGADGMVDMKNAGAATMAQDEESSIVFGMPKEAYRRGGTDRLVPLKHIPAVVKQALSGN